MLPQFLPVSPTNLCGWRTPRPLYRLFDFFVTVITVWVPGRRPRSCGGEVGALGPALPFVQNVANQAVVEAVAFVRFGSQAGGQGCFQDV
jgi:hypothetical protein